MVGQIALQTRALEIELLADGLPRGAKFGQHLGRDFHQAGVARHGFAFVHQGPRDGARGGRHNAEQATGWHELTNHAFALGVRTEDQQCEHGEREGNDHGDHQPAPRRRIQGDSAHQPVLLGIQCLLPEKRISHA